MSDKFDTLELNTDLLRNLESLEFDSMTPIQKEALPIVLSGKDLIAKAKTGSGKTAAFSLGILNKLNMNQKDPQALILCPTRELADQVAKETRMLARTLSNIKVLTICGGTSEYHQDNSLLHGAHIIVGTPGRVLKLLKKETLKPSGIKTLVLDEGDRMLDMGFEKELKEIERALPKERQTLLFSATFPLTIKDLSKHIQIEAEMVQVDTVHEKSTIEEKFFELESHKDKNQALLSILGKYNPDRFIIFCKTKQIVSNVAKFLDQNKIISAGIHGDIEQNERTVVLEMFKNESISGLVATDVAARGLDIKDLPLVINYDLPIDTEDYTHRIGRTGRAGESGAAVSFMVEQEQFKLEDIEEYTKRKFQKIKYLEEHFHDNYERTPPMDTMFISGGKKDKLRPGDIVGALIHEAGLESSDIGNILITNIVSYVAVKADKIEAVITALNSAKIKNRKFKVGLA
jgi:ATP-independent RNA helicase DbpA